MNDKVEEVEEMSWEEYDKRENEAGKYLRVEIDKPYEIMVKSAKLVRDSKFKDRNGNPKIKLVLELSSVNNQPSDKIFETSSFTVIKEIRIAKRDESLPRSVFLLKKKQEQDKTKYVFEKLRELGRFPIPSKAEAFI